MNMHAGRFPNPFRPGAGHPPPYLAGREAEQEIFSHLLKQEVILENMVLTGLRGVGKTVLLETLKPVALDQGWLWVGADLSETASLREEHMATRLCTDLSLITSSVAAPVEQSRLVGFGTCTETVERRLDYPALTNIYRETPGLALDKVKTVLETAWAALAPTGARGIVFAYDEAQNLADHADREEYPLSLLLDAFQSVQRKEFPLMLVLTGLPTLFSELVEARTFSERMFRVIFLDRLSDDDSREAIRRPIANTHGAVRLSDASVDTIVNMSGGYPYFIQFICKEVYDAFIQRMDSGEDAVVPVSGIMQKLDMGFFAGRWGRLTDRQRELLFVMAMLDDSDGGFSVQEAVVKSRIVLSRPFGSSHVHQMLTTLGEHGLIFKKGYGRYAFAIPLLADYIRRRMEGVGMGG